MADDQLFPRTCGRCAGASVVRRILGWRTPARNKLLTTWSNAVTAMACPDQARQLRAKVSCRGGRNRTIPDKLLRNRKRERETGRYLSRDEAGVLRTGHSLERIAY